MTTVTEKPRPSYLPTEEQMEVYRRIMREANAAIGILELDLTINPEDVQALMIAEGIRPEDNGASRDIMRMRYGADYDPDNDPYLKEVGE